MTESTEDRHEPHAVVAGDEVPQAGDLVIDPTVGIAPEPLVGTGQPSPLDEPDSPLPEPALLAMKDRRHSQWSKLLTGEGDQDLEMIVGPDAAALYVIGDRKHHAMISRIVGSSPSCTYVLVGRITMEQLDHLVDGTLATVDAFGLAREIELVGVAVLESIATANIIEVARYASAEEIPDDFAVGSPVHRFAQDLEITAY
jgi:hypothetical protein